MIRRLALMVMIIASFYIEYSIFISKDISFDIWGFLVLLISISFKIGASLYVYKDFVGWDNFEDSEGLSLKRKK